MVCNQSIILRKPPEIHTPKVSLAISVVSCKRKPTSLNEASSPGSVLHALSYEHPATLT